LEGASETLAKQAFTLGGGERMKRFIGWWRDGVVFFHVSVLLFLEKGLRMRRPGSSDFPVNFDGFPARDGFPELFGRLKAPDSPHGIQSGAVHVRPSAAFEDAGVADSPPRVDRDLQQGDDIT
jgi:hypothetical protein